MLNILPEDKTELRMIISYINFQDSVLKLVT